MTHSLFSAEHMRDLCREKFSLLHVVKTTVDFEAKMHALERISAIEDEYNLLSDGIRLLARCASDAA